MVDDWLMLTLMVDCLLLMVDGSLTVESMLNGEYFQTKQKIHQLIFTTNQQYNPITSFNLQPSTFNLPPSLLPKI